MSDRERILHFFVASMLLDVLGALAQSIRNGTASLTDILIEIDRDEIERDIHYLLYESPYANKSSCELTPSADDLVVDAAKQVNSAFTYEVIRGVTFHKNIVHVHLDRNAVADKNVRRKVEGFIKAL
jgi:hypothetical protein